MITGSAPGKRACGLYMQKNWSGTASFSTSHQQRTYAAAARIHSCQKASRLVEALELLVGMVYSGIVEDQCVQIGSFSVQLARSEGDEASAVRHG